MQATLARREHGRFLWVLLSETISFLHRFKSLSSHRDKSGEARECSTLADTVSLSEMLRVLGGFGDVLLRNRGDGGRLIH